MNGELGKRDARVCWHPYTQHGLEQDRPGVVSASAAWLTLSDGRKILDGISSWWACLHGHAHPRLVEALGTQARALDHVLFAGFTHEPAVRLSERLLELAPPGLGKAFFSDNGSTAVEVALKACYQASRMRDAEPRDVFLVLEEGYHGDTVGAMSVGDPDPFFEAYGPLLFDVERVAPRAAALNEAFDRLGTRVCAFLLEPEIQGAAGMVRVPSDVLVTARARCDEVGAALIADEVMTGFGRTGRLFACEHAGVTPDALCLSKGLTSGMLPLAVTLFRDEIYEAFLDDDRSRTFFHGHTYTANPLGCAVALASLDLVQENDTPRRLAEIGARIHAGVKHLADHTGVRELRHLGGMVAIELEAKDQGYLSRMGDRLRGQALDPAHRVLLRPLGHVLYALPPACLTSDESDLVAATMCAVVERALA